MDEANEKKQATTELKKQYDEARKKENSVNEAIEKLENEMDNFQREKMRKLNKLHVYIPL